MVTRPIPVGQFGTLGVVAALPLFKRVPIHRTFFPKVLFEDIKSKGGSKVTGNWDDAIFSIEIEDASLPTHRQKRNLVIVSAGQKHEFSLGNAKNRLVGNWILVRLPEYEKLAQILFGNLK